MARTPASPLSRASGVNGKVCQWHRRRVGERRQVCDDVGQVQQGAERSEDDGRSASARPCVPHPFRPSTGGAAVCLLTDQGGRHLSQVWLVLTHLSTNRTGAGLCGCLALCATMRRTNRQVGNRRYVPTAVGLRLASGESSVGSGCHLGRFCRTHVGILSADDFAGSGGRGGLSRRVCG